MGHIEQTDPLTIHALGIEPSERATALRQLTLPLIAASIAFLPRVLRLDGHDIWGDEAYSIYVSSQSLTTVVSGGIDTHPPLYHLLLHFWLLALGRSEFAIRFLSAAIGLLIVVLTYALARRIAGERLALLAALVSAIAPFQVYYSQEARMYALVTLLCLASVYALISVLDQPSRTNWAIYVLTSIGAVYSHYYAFFVLGAEAIFIVIWFLSNRRQQWASPRLTALIVSLVLVALSYVPWAIVQTSFIAAKASARMGEFSISGAVRLFKESLVAFGVGTTLPGAPGNYVAAFFLLAFLSGAVWLARQPATRLYSPLILLYCGVPLLLAFMVNPFMPFFYPRYVLLATPAYYIGIGGAIEALASRWRWLVPIPLAIIIVVSACSINNYYFDPRFARGGYGHMMRYVAAHAGPNYVLILGNRLQEALFDYYRPSKPTEAFYFPTDHLTSDPRTGEEIARIMAEHDRAWLVMFGDPAGFDPNGDLKRWLGQTAFLTFSQGFVDAQLCLYSKPTAGRDAQALQHQDVSANFGSLIKLTAADFSTQTAPEQPVYLTLYWESLAPTDVRFTVFTHVIDANSNVVGQMDSEPVGGTRPTSEWKSGDKIRDTLALEIKSDTPPGQYTIEVGLYELANLKRLPVLGSDGKEKDDRVLLGPITIGSGG